MGVGWPENPVEFLGEDHVHLPWTGSYQSPRPSLESRWKLDPGSRVGSWVRSRLWFWSRQIPLPRFQFIFP